MKFQNFKRIQENVPSQLITSEVEKKTAPSNKEGNRKQNLPNYPTFNSPDLYLDSTETK